MSTSSAPAMTMAPRAPPTGPRALLDGKHGREHLRLPAPSSTVPSSGANAGQGTSPRSSAPLPRRPADRPTPRGLSSLPDGFSSGGTTPRPTVLSQQKRSGSPLPHPKPPKRREHRTEYYAYTTGETDVALRIDNDNLRAKTDEQEQVIKAMKERIAVLAAERHAVCKYGRKRTEDMPRDEPQLWNRIRDKCWKKEFNENPTPDDPGDLSEDDGTWATSTDSNVRDAYDSGIAGTWDLASSLVEADIANALDPQVAFEDLLHEVGYDSVAQDAANAAKLSTHDAIDAHIESLRSVVGATHSRGLDRVLLMHFVEDGAALPVPLGKEGHPFYKGWAWERFRTHRLVKEKCADPRDYVSPNHPLFKKLAIEASELEFMHRSATQRDVVSIALQVPALKASLFSTVPEPDVLEMCKTNATLLPAAVRRQYFEDVAGDAVYTEFCVHDLTLYILLHCAGPADAKRDDRRRWYQLLDRFVLEWLSIPGRGAEKADPLQDYEDCYFKNGPEPFPSDLLAKDFFGNDESEVMTALWRHLLRCGLLTEHMRNTAAGAGLLFLYMWRSREALDVLTRHRTDFKARCPDGNQKLERLYTSVRGLWFPIPALLPRLRIPLSQDERARWVSKYKPLSLFLHRQFDAENEKRELLGLATIEYPKNNSCYLWVPLPPADQ
ncbi:hypothetical protein EXIGLDRAFT_721081 [Exidia glandulosa HHB12029]|uniref:Uncharacterized protein n=1 Tax=Exidia glandulosa HHB12029 TaxID=1314781 RepID=A0A165FZW1_EXIGL|nr:hypothetical protein EXIGLDRAFT_721081 [Exidia glandulosa HHB12029]